MDTHSTIYNAVNRNLKLRETYKLELLHMIPSPPFASFVGLTSVFPFFSFKYAIGTDSFELLGGKCGGI